MVMWLNFDILKILVKIPTSQKGSHTLLVKIIGDYFICLW
jgi:hypothetical protein